MEERKKVLVAPLDWGLGHATRCIPIIKLLEEKGAEVIIAADGRAAELLKEEFPSLKHIHLKGYRIRYSKTLSMVVMITFQIPKIVFSIIREHVRLKKIIREEQPNVVISDNRFGLWNKKNHSVFITHQLMVKCPQGLKFLEPQIHRIILWFVKKYDECWIPDVEGAKNLSGNLSRKYPLPANAQFIGLLSRFNSEQSISTQIKYDVLALLSGTEPQRTVLERILSEQIQKTNYSTFLVRGVTEEQKQFHYENNLTVVSHLNSSELFSAMCESEIIICRSGYSTLMDLAATGKKAILIPTPGQTEQEYLAIELSKKNIFHASTQQDFSLAHALQEVKLTTGLKKEEYQSELEIVLTKLLKK